MKHLTIAAVLHIGCVPSFVDEPWRVTTTRVLAVKSEPAEGPPGAVRTLHALVADVADSNAALEPLWSLCDAPKPVTENNAVATGCMDPQHLLQQQLGRNVVLPTLADACIRFGPDTSGQGYRPRAADDTGGYYQPVRLDLLGEVPVFHQARLSCRLAEAPLYLATEYSKRYVVNSNPTLLSLTAQLNGKPVVLSELSAGDAPELTATWSAESIETYAYFDRKQQMVVDKRETLRVDWYVSGGMLEAGNTLIDSETAELHANNVWTLPSATSRIAVWVVLRDSRGGSDFLVLRLLP